LCVSALLDDAEFGAFVAGKADEVFLLEFSNRLSVCVADVGPLFPLGLWFCERGMEFLMDFPELEFKLICGIRFADVLGLWIGRKVGMLEVLGFVSLNCFHRIWFASR